MTHTADAVKVDISVSRNWFVFGATFFLLASLKDPDVLLVFAFLVPLALTKIRFVISSTAPVLRRNFIVAGIPVFSRRYESSHRARLRFRSNERTTVLQLDLVDTQLTTLQSSNDELLDRTAAASYEPLSKWTGSHTIA